MTYKITPNIGDGKADAPPIEVTVDDNLTDPYGQTLGELIEGELTNDYDQPFGAGFTLTVERVA